MRYVQVFDPVERFINIDDIEIGETVRKDLNLQPLIEDISQNGIRDPIVVQSIGQESPGLPFWRLIDGLRRVEALRAIGHEEIPALTFMSGGKVIQM